MELEEIKIILSGKCDQISQLERKITSFSEEGKKLESLLLQKEAQCQELQSLLAKESGKTDGLLESIVKEVNQTAEKFAKQITHANAEVSNCFKERCTVVSGLEENILKFMERKENDAIKMQKSLTEEIRTTLKNQSSLDEERRSFEQYKAKVEEEL